MCLSLIAVNSLPSKLQLPIIFLTLASTAWGANRILFKPHFHVRRVPPMAAMQTCSGSSLHRQLTEGTIEQRGSANGATSPLRATIAIHTDHVQCHHIHSTARRLLRGHRQVFEHLGSGHDQTPTMQQICVALLQVIVEESMLVCQENRLPRLGHLQGASKVVQRPGITTELLQLVRQMEALQLRVDGRIEG